MFFPWWSQRFVRKYKDPITDNSFIDFNRSQKVPRKESAFWSNVEGRGWGKYVEGSKKLKIINQ